MVRQKLLFIIFAFLTMAFLGTNVLAQVLEDELDWQQAITNNEISVTAESNGEFQQVVAVWADKKKILVDKKRNNLSPERAGEYMVWSANINGYNQIFRKHLPTNTDTQLTFASNNINPTVDVNGNTAWERWTGEGWQIYLFDGISVTPVSDKSTALNPQISSGILFFAEKHADISWKLKGYSLSEKKYSELFTGPGAKDFELSQDTIRFTDGKQVNNLQIANFFSLGQTEDSALRHTPDTVREEILMSTSEILLDKTSSVTETEIEAETE